MYCFSTYFYIEKDNDPNRLSLYYDSVHGQSGKILHSTIIPRFSMNQKTTNPHKGKFDLNLFRILFPSEYLYTKGFIYQSDHELY